MNTSNALTLRRKLVEDFFHDTEDYNAQPLELPADTLIDLCFPDIDIATWCRAVGLTYSINTNPDPAFSSSTTIILSPVTIPDEQEINDEYL